MRSAFESFSQAAKRIAKVEDPTSKATEAKLRIAMAMVLQGLGRSADAMLELGQSLQIDPKNWKAHANLAVLQASLVGTQPDFLRNALHHFDSAILLSPVATKQTLKSQRAELANRKKAEL